MILIVDSEKTAEIKIKQEFDEFGFESVMVVKTAAKALEILELTKYIFSLIIIDSVLDDADGFGFCSEVRKTETGKNVYIMLLVSSAENKSAIEKAMRCGASGYSVKPYSKGEFQKHFFKYVYSKVVLLIEDDPVIREMVKKILSSHNVEVIEIDDGIKAHNLINKIFPPRLVLMDIGLPNKSGIELVESIRSKGVWRKTPVVMLTGSSDVSDVKKCMNAGANDYITKPVNIDNFRKRIDRYLGYL